MDSRTACRLRNGLFVAAMFCLGIGSRVSHAQSIWEFSAYDIRVWVAVDPQLPSTEQATRDVVAELQRRGAIAFFPDWKVTVERCPVPLQIELSDPANPVTFERLRSVDIAENRFRISSAPPKADSPKTEGEPKATSPNPVGSSSSAGAVNATESKATTSSTTESTAKAGQGEAMRADKLFVVSIYQADTLRVAVREFDCRFRLWSAAVEAEIPSLEVAAERATGMMAQTFSPILRIEKVDGKNIIAKSRAGGLVTADDSMVLVRKGDILLSAIRKTARSTSSNEPAKMVVEIPPWTYIQVEDGDGRTINGKIHTGIAQPIPVKGGARVERLAMVVRRPYAASKLKLVSRDRLKTPLSGYEIFSKVPGSEEVKFVGLSDFRGEYEMTPDENPLRVLYLKNGGQLLGRLPVVAGSVPQYTLSLPNDDRRLEVEGLVQSLQTEVTDLVARREILSARIKIKLGKGEVDAAKKLLEDFRALRTRDDLSKQLEADMKRIMPTLPPGEKLTRSRVEKLFAEAQLLIGRFLDPAAADKLAQDIAAAPPSSPPPAETPPAPPPAPATPPPAAK